MPHILSPGTWCSVPVDSGFALLLTTRTHVLQRFHHDWYVVRLRQNTAMVVLNFRPLIGERSLHHFFIFIVVFMIEIRRLSSRRVNSTCSEVDWLSTWYLWFYARYRLSSLDMKLILIEIQDFQYNEFCSEEIAVHFDLNSSPNIANYWFAIYWRQHHVVIIDTLSMYCYLLKIALCNDDWVMMIEIC